MKYAYPAIFTAEDNGQYSVHFRDFDEGKYSCFTGGNDLTHAIEMAQDALCLTLYWMEQDGEPIPTPSEVNTVKTGDNEFVSLIACDTDFYRRFYESKAVKKNLTIPSWLNTMAENQKINFSHVLQEALKQQLGINK